MALAQKNSWTIGLDFGTIGAVWQKGNVVDAYRNRIEAPLYYELTISYGITRHLSITTGIAYNMYAEAGFKRQSIPYGLTFNETFSSSKFFLYEYSSVDIPIKLNYSIPLGNSRFYFMGSVGLIIDVVNADDPSCTPRPAQDDGTWMQNDAWVLGRIYGINNEYAVYTGVRGFMYNKKVDFLINTGIGFGYRFKCGVGLSLTGAYNTGTRIMGELDIKNQLTFNSNGTPIFTSDPVLKEYVDRLYFKGDYWKVALGISYTFKRKKKE